MGRKRSLGRFVLATPLALSLIAGIVVIVSAGSLAPVLIGLPALALVALFLAAVLRGRAPSFDGDEGPAGSYLATVFGRRSEVERDR
jgi:hypothetical protein